MKRIISILLVLFLVFSLSACKRNGEEDNTETTDSPDETTTQGFEFATDENGELVTDADGKLVFVNPWEGLFGGDINSIFSTSSESFTLISDETMPTGSKVEVTVDSSGKPKDSLIDKALGNTFKGDKYSMKFNAQIYANGTKQTMPAAVYVSGNKSLIELSLSTASLAKFGILSNDSGNYFLINALSGMYKGYSKLSDEDAEEYNIISNFADFSDTEDLDYVKTEKVTYKGVEYLCEEYRGEDSTTRFFFSNEKLSRIENIGDDGSRVFLENIEITTNFSESVFDIKGYKEFNENDLAGLSGLLG
ncbi:MAG: hypothetical protein ACOYJX_01220 [Acutalibacteraceae bacterium]|jgi:hypothetical protein